MSINDGNGDPMEFDDSDIDIADNEAQVIVTLSRDADSIEGYVDQIEGVEFDPGDTEDAPGMDTLRLAAEMVLVAAGYDEDEVHTFLDTASRGPVQVTDVE